MLRKHCIDYECYILSHCELNIVNTIGLSYVTQSQWYSGIQCDA